jgi:Collagen triple helix repeat (20 copies)
MFLLAGAIVALGAVTAGTAGVQALITSAQIKDGTIASRDIKNGSIVRADLSAGTLSSLRGPRGVAGAAGAQGPAAAQGAQGPAGPQGPQGDRGPQGEKGEKGDTGAQGAKGDPGAGVHVTGSVATADELPDSAEEGDAYIVTSTGHLHVWEGDEFVDTGLVQGPQGEQGPVGPAGPQGPKGDTGSTGPAGGLAGYEIVEGDPVEIGGDEFDDGFAACTAGKVAVGGGMSFEDALMAGPSDSYPSATGDRWIVSAFNFSTETNVMTPYVICADEA